ncbi:hypothetical protein HAX54_034358, partial [Datura stramonium]|nr:hypothetical protein [Datura stramonium]
EQNMCTHTFLSHLYGMQMLQLRMIGVMKEQLHQLNIDYPLSEHLRAIRSVGLGFEEPLDDDDSTDEEQARVDSNLESDDDGVALRWGKLLLPPQTMRIRKGWHNKRFDILPFQCTKWHDAKGMMDY